MKYLKQKLLNYLYPNFKCENCIGLQEYGCYCDFYGCVAPGTPPNRLQKFLRKYIKYETLG